jgi:hypothetical protein
MPSQIDLDSIAIFKFYNIFLSNSALIFFCFSQKNPSDVRLRRLVVHIMLCCVLRMSGAKNRPQSNFLEPSKTAREVMERFDGEKLLYNYWNTFLFLCRPTLT